jgi:endonuclease YncB( thermonuclease family)
MDGRIVVAVALLVSAAPAEARRRPHGRAGASAVFLDGAATDVRWTDGDTFRIWSGPLRGRSARLEGYNTLETFGPVHRWGGWSGAELLELARAATRFVARGSWECAARGEEDRYGRLLVACPGAAAELVRRGLAMAYGVGRPVDGDLLALQREAQARGAGMWAKGVPSGIVTSVHSAAEGARGAYNRVADTRTGIAGERRHDTSYATCELVCEGVGRDRSCMVYVPYERRYRHRPWCLRR